jgi:3-methyl-2-oxobutanoate hydroxymethyltransferase
MKDITGIFRKKNINHEKISIVTCYDYSFARIVNESNVDAILVGDSLGMVIQGHSTTLPVTIDEIIYHTKAVKNGAPDKPVIADMPFMSYQAGFETAVLNAGRIFKETNAEAIKLEGASESELDLIDRLVEIGIPVMGHLGLTPQSVHTLGGYKVQGKTENDQNQMILDAKNLESAKCFSLVLEMIPQSLGKKISESISIPTIGIGAGKDTKGQVLVLQDLLGFDSRFSPKFAKKYTDLESIVSKALNQYSEEVKKIQFPAEENEF